MATQYWWEAFSMTVHVIIRLPTSAISQTPFEALYNKKPEYKFLKTFGCSCFPCLKPYNKHKLKFHYEKCVFLGPSGSHKGYKCLSPSGKIYIYPDMISLFFFFWSRHVFFNENEFPFSAQRTSIMNKPNNFDSNSKALYSFYHVPMLTLPDAPAVSFFFIKLLLCLHMSLYLHLIMTQAHELSLSATSIPLLVLYMMESTDHVHTSGDEVLSSSLGPSLCQTQLVIKSKILIK